MKEKNLKSSVNLKSSEAPQQEEAMQQQLTEAQHQIMYLQELARMNDESQYRMQMLMEIREIREILRNGLKSVCEILAQAHGVEVEGDEE